MATKWQVAMPDVPVWTARDISASVVYKMEKGTIFTGTQRGNWVRLQGKPWSCMISNGERFFLQKVPVYDNAEATSSDDESPLGSLDGQPWTAEDWSRHTTPEKPIAPGSPASGSTRIEPKLMPDVEGNSMSVPSEDESTNDGGDDVLQMLNSELVQERVDERMSSNAIERNTVVPVPTFAKWKVTAHDLPVFTARDISASVVYKLKVGTIITGVRKGNWVRLHGEPWCCMLSNSEGIFLEKVMGTEGEEVVQAKHEWDFGCAVGLAKLMRNVASTCYTH
jgi:hypothetical protein